ACSTGLRNPELSATAGAGCVTRNDVYVVQVATNTGATLRVPSPATLGRNTEHSNRVVNFDMSFFKLFRVRENLRLEYRLDAFNVFNHPQFSGIPSQSLNAASGSFLNY